MTLRFLSSDGYPAPGLKVKIGKKTGTTSFGGAVKFAGLKAGKQRVTLVLKRPGDDAETRTFTKRVSVTLQPGANGTKSVRVSDFVVVRGVVRDSKGKPLRGQTVTLVEGDSGSTTGRTNSRGAYSLLYAITADKTAEYLVTVAVEVEKNVTAFAPATIRETSARRYSAGRAKSTRVNVTVPKLASGGVTGKVVAADGTPVKNAVVGIELSTTAGTELAQVVYTKKDGTYHARHLIPGKYTISIHAKKSIAQPKEITVKKKSVKAGTHRILGTGTLVATITTAGASDPVSTLLESDPDWLTLGWIQSETVAASNSPENVQHTVTYTNVPAGKYRVRINRPSGPVGEWVTVLAGESTNAGALVQPPQPATTTLTGTVKLSDGKATQANVQVYDADGTLISAYSNKSNATTGKFEVKRAHLDGTYFVVATKSQKVKINGKKTFVAQQGSSTVTLTNGTVTPVVDITLAPAAKVTVRTVAGGKAVDGVRVDLVRLDDVGPFARDSVTTSYPWRSNKSVFRHVSPGVKYRLRYVDPDVTGIKWIGPTFTLKAGQNKTVTAKVQR
ncbi:hypothetical protein GCM10010401_15370 [Rarobacter faecitabidus]|uniref:carboxypeptidase regulatory-like domain-containing protein n=1 Tax=Rarobacter faecitabidus TaxID=13243 RepID=UPI001B8846D0|nr:carboxypeptidase regulatory-like domain-containing protein [Rarobacter faecitabidus]